MLLHELKLLRVASILCGFHLEIQDLTPVSKNKDFRFAPHLSKIWVNDLFSPSNLGICPPLPGRRFQGMPVITLHQFPAPEKVAKEKGFTA